MSEKRNNLSAKYASALVTENWLGAGVFLYLGENGPTNQIDKAQISNKPVDDEKLTTVLETLKAVNLLTQVDVAWALTPEGTELYQMLLASLEVTDPKTAE